MIEQAKWAIERLRDRLETDRYLAKDLAVAGACACMVLTIVIILVVI